MNRYQMILQKEPVPSLTFMIQAPCSSGEILQELHISRKLRHRLFQEKRICVNASILSHHGQLQPYDVMEIFYPQEVERIPSWKQPLRISYEDDLFLIVQKPVGMLVHSDGINTSHTLNNCVQAYYDEQGLQLPVRPLHRLDYETSGLVIYCKLPFLQPYLDALLQEKQIERIYLAWVKGQLHEQAILVDQPIARDRHNAKKMRISPNGAAARTWIYPKEERKNATLVECHLESGRTHQIRIHLAWLHHPILSDPLYGTKDSRIKRCALHAWKVRLYHPLLDETLEVCCELPEDMKQI